MNEMLFDDLTDNMILEIFKKINSWEVLKDVCSMNNRMYDICRNNKNILIANVLFNKYGNNSLLNQQCWQFGDNSEVFKELITLGVDITINDNFPLRNAVELGFFNVFVILHQKGADIHVDEDFLLRRAARLGYLNIVRYLVEQGCDVYENNEVYNVLFQGVLSGNVDLVEYLHQTVGMNINKEDIVDTAAENGDFEMVAYLLENGAPATDNALIEALEIDDTDIVEILLEHGANPNAEDFTPLFNSIRNGFIETLELLVDYGANLHENEAAALEVAIEGGEEMLDWLIEHGLNVQLNGRDALIAAIEQGSFSIVRRLMRAGADISENNYEAIFIAVQSDDINVVKALLRNTNIDTIPNEILVEARDQAEGLDIYYFLDQYIEDD